MKKSGYLNSDYKLFHLCDTQQKKIESHYHDFHKLYILLKGNVSYYVEGQEYNLTSGDIILIHAGQIHYPIVHDETPYDRVILYLSPDYFHACLEDGSDLFTCFRKAKDEHSSLIRLSKRCANELNGIIISLANSAQDTAFASDLLQKVKLTEFLILLNRILNDKNYCNIQPGTSNKTVQKIMHYINDNITEPLSIDQIAEHVFLDRSYIMHLFKSESGYTIGRYITEKRLFLAREYIAKGFTVTDACYQSGF